MFSFYYFIYFKYKENINAFFLCYFLITVPVFHYPLLSWSVFPRPAAIPRWSSLKVCSLILFVRQLVKGYKIQGFIIIHITIIISVLSKQELEIESQSYYTFHYHLGRTHKCIFVHMCFRKNIELCFTCFTFSVHYT